MSARPPPPLLPLGNVSLKKTSKNKESLIKALAGLAADIAKATLRYVKSRRMEISECDQDDDATKIALTTIDKHIEEWQGLIDQGKLVSVNQENTSKKFEKVVVKNTAWNFDHENSFTLPVKEFSTLDWSSIINIGKSVEGTEGVFFVKFPKNFVVVVKASSTLGAELYGAVLAKRIGVAAPGMRIINRQSREGTDVLNNMIMKEPRVKDYLSQPLFILMEYVKGVVLGDVILDSGNIRNESADRNKFVLDKFGDPPRSLHDVGRNNLLQFGRMIGLDFITNNFDRFPVVWNNNGNPGNVMFYGNMEEDGVAEEVANRIVAIDNMTSCISRSKFKAEYDAYADKTSTVLAALFQDPTSINDAFNRVRMFLENGVPNGGWPGLHIDIGETGVKIVQEGFLESLAAVGDMEKNELYNVKEALENLFCSSSSSDVDRKFRYGLERVDPEFIVDIATSMHDAVASDLNALGTSSPDSSPQIKAVIKRKKYKNLLLLFRVTT